MRQKKLLLILTLLCAVAQGAWADDEWETVYVQTQTTAANWIELSGGSSTGGTLGSEGSTMYYYATGDLSFTNSNAGGSGLTILGTVYLYIPSGVTLTCRGANASGLTGAGAGIELGGGGNSLYLLGGGTLNATGGNAANGGDGSAGGDAGWNNNGIWPGNGGSGGYGGGGAGAGIGTRGGNGGAGGAGGSISTVDWDGHDGIAGSSGSDGGTAAAMGSLYVYQTLGTKVNATGGSQGSSGGTGGNGGNSALYASSKNYSMAGGGGGAGGGFGGGASDIGTGGCGGGGGGGGAAGSTNWASWGFFRVGAHGGVPGANGDAAVAPSASGNGGNTLMSSGTYDTSLNDRGWENNRDNRAAGGSGGGRGDATTNGAAINLVLYLISSADDWNKFADNVNKEDFSGEYYVKLTADISVSETVGTDRHPFKGTFLGNGKTLTFNNSTWGSYCAPFRYVSDATIQGLNVKGNIYTYGTATHAGGLVGRNSGTTNISDCHVSTVLHTRSRGQVDEGDYWHGGIVGYHASGSLTITGCAYTGAMLTIDGDAFNCGFVDTDWSSVTITNSLFAPNFNVPKNNDEFAVYRGYTFASTRSGSLTITNCYYTNKLGTAQGTEVRAITHDEYVTVANAEAISNTYANSGPTFYTTGFQCGDVHYAVSGQDISLTLGSQPNCQVTAFAASAGTLLGSGSSYTLTMPNQNVTIRATAMTAGALTGEGTSENPFTINSAGDWETFCAQVWSGNSYSGQYVKLTADIAVTKMAGTSGDNSFQGTFLGNNKTLTFTKGSAENLFSEQNCAPFRYTKNATIRNLKAAGNIYTNQKFAAGLVGRCLGTTNITNCQVGTNIHSSVNGDGTHGGIIAMPENNTTTTIEGCVYNGRLLTCSGTHSCGGFVGWSGNNTATASNSLYIPSGSIPSGWSAINGGSTFVRGNSPTITNCYYTATMGGAQGKLVLDVVDEATFAGALMQAYGFVTAFDYGILFDGKYYIASRPLTMVNDADDNSAAITAAVDYKANVLLQGRTLYRDCDWNTLCLPFNVSVLEGSPLEGATVMTLSTSGTGFDATSGTLTLNFENATEIEAGKPYIVKWEGGVQDPFFNPSDAVVESLGFISEVPTFDGGQATWWTHGENPENLVDGNTNTKYGLDHANPWVEFHYASPITPKGYALWTSEDTHQYPNRNPSQWNISAKNSGDAGWTHLVYVNNANNDKLPKANSQRTVFALNNNTAYQYYKFEATRFNNEFQLSELQFCTVRPNIPFPDIVNPVFSGVTVIDADLDGKSITSTDGTVTFRGNYDYQSFTKANRSILFLGASNTLYYPEDGAGIGACRAYFQLNGITAGAPNAGVRAFVLKFGDGETTGIESLTPGTSPKDKGSGYWSSLDGRRLSGKPTRAGVYINNGKKTVIK